jgi:hypothetical protein
MLNEEPIELHDQLLNERENRFIEHIEEHRASKISPNNNKNFKTLLEENGNRIKQLIVPFRALNEVFIGESLSSRFLNLLYNILEI